MLTQSIDTDALPGQSVNSMLATTFDLHQIFTSGEKYIYIKMKIMLNDLSLMHHEKQRLFLW